MRSHLTSPAIWILFASLAAAQDAADDKVAREERLAAMRKIAARFTVKAGEGEQARDVPLMEAPILRFNDPAREFHDATLWAWGDKGRPLCLLAIEQYKDSWFECISLADEPLVAVTKELKWQPKPPGISLQPFPGAPKPAKDAPRRLAQMKTLLGNLTAHEIGRTGSRYELRLMTTPLYRYEDAESELVDGAIFAFAYGTNPELLAIMEARGPKDAAKWHVAFARCGTAEPYVMLGDKELFHLPYARQSKPTDPYWNFAYRFPEEK
jgi:hypothetical protein